MAMIRVVHNGTEMSLTVAEMSGRKSLKVVPKGDAKEHVIRVEGDSKIDLFCPSVEGTIIWCALKNGEELFFDSLSGARLDQDELRKRNPTFYT